MSAEKRLPPLWTPSQRGVIAGAVALLIAWLAIRFWLNPVHVSDPQPERPARFDELADRIDPNTADAATLAALPGLGPARARDIVAYRESFKHPDPTRRPFERPEDLLKVKGIGVSMLETMRPYLLFPATQPTTRHELTALRASPARAPATIGSSTQAATSPRGESQGP